MPPTTASVLSKRPLLSENVEHKKEPSRPTSHSMSMSVRKQAVRYIMFTFARISRPLPHWNDIGEYRRSSSTTHAGTP